MNFNPQMFTTGAGGFLGGLFGDSGAPYDAAEKEYRDWVNKTQGVQQPFYDAGKGALGEYQNWLTGQKDPAGFINNLTSQYKESPYAHYLQQQSMNAGQNAASASGLMGSTPLMQQLQQNATNISGQDMNTWLQNVLGVNKQYGEGQHNLVQGGQSSANALSDTYNNAGKQLGETAYGKTAGKQQDFWNKLGGILNMAGSFL